MARKILLDRVLALLGSARRPTSGSYRNRGPGTDKVLKDPRLVHSLPDRLNGRGGR